MNYESFVSWIFDKDGTEKNCYCIEYNCENNDDESERMENYQFLMTGKIYFGEISSYQSHSQNLN